MTLSFKHNFTTAKADGTDASLLRPSNWNAEHTVTLAHNTLIGRATVGSGAAEEIPVTDATIALLAKADIAAILAYLGISPATTGDGKLTLKTAADTGWLMMDDGTFGDASSGASNRANADTAALFTLLYALTDANAPLLTSAGAATTRAAQGTAAAAYAAHCRMTLPKQLGRAIVGAGTGASLTARALGSAFGAETATLLTANLPPYTPTGAITNGAITINGSAMNISGLNNFSGGGGGAFAVGSAAVSLTASQAASSFAGVAQGGTSTPVNITQASAAWNVMVKL